MPNGRHKKFEDVWDWLPYWARGLVIICTLVASSWAGGAISTRTLDTYAGLPLRVQALELGQDTLHSELDTLQDYMVDQFAVREAYADSMQRTSEQLFMYLVCRQEEGDGQCNYILPEEINRRLNEILGRSP